MGDGFSLRPFIGNITIDTAKAKQLRDLYDAYVDTAAIEKAGLKPARKDLDSFARIQTLDGVAKVQPFYSKQLNQGDWLVNFSDSPPGSFKATFTRKSNSRVSGTLSAGTSSGATKILMTLAVPR